MSAETWARGAGLLETADLGNRDEGTYRPAARRLLATGKVTVTKP